MPRVVLTSIPAQVSAAVPAAGSKSYPSPEVAGGWGVGSHCQKPGPPGAERPGSVQGMVASCPPPPQTIQLQGPGMSGCRLQSNPTGAGPEVLRHPQRLNGAWPAPPSSFGSRLPHPFTPSSPQDPLPTADPGISPPPDLKDGSTLTPLLPASRPGPNPGSLCRQTCLPAWPHDTGHPEPGRQGLCPPAPQWAIPPFLR